MSNNPQSPKYLPRDFSNDSDLETKLENILRVENGEAPVSETEPLLSAPLSVSNACTRKDVQVEPPMRILIHPRGHCLMIICRPCKSPIEVTLVEDDHQYIKKCSACQEVTPIRHAPEGKKYVRCSCLRLLVCKENSTTVRCPQCDCELIIHPRIDVANATSRTSGMFEVFCAYCRKVRLLDSLEYALIGDCLCYQTDALGSVNRSTIGIIIGSLSLFVLIALMVSGRVSGQPALSVYYFATFIVCSFLLVMIARCCGTRMSRIENESPYQTI